MRISLVVLFLAFAVEAQNVDLTFRRISADQPYPEFCSVSHDGSLLSYLDSKTGNLAVRNLATGETRALTKAGSPVGDHAMWSIFSRDNHQIAFVWAGASGQEIRIADLGGSSARTIWKQPKQDWMTLNDWSPDGRQLLIAQTHYGTNTEILLMSVTDGAVTRLKAQPTDAGRMAFSKDGKWIAHNGTQASGDPEADIYLLSRDGAQDTPIVIHPANDSLLGWSADGTRIFFTSDRTGVIGLWTVGIQNGHVSGSPAMIKDEIGSVKVPLGVTDHNTLFYASTVSEIDVYEAVLNLEAGTVRLSGDPVTRHYAGANSYPSWSPEGDSFSYLSNPSSGRRILFVQPRNAQADKSFTPRLAWFNRPEWLNRGVIAVTGSDLAGMEGLYGIDPGTGDSRILLNREENESVFHGQWSRDGRSFYNRHADARKGIYRVDLTTRVKQTIYVPSDAWRVAGAALSPDDGQLAFEEDDYSTGLSRLLLLRLDGKTETRELMRLAAGERFPCCRPFHFSPDSRHLLVVRADSLEGTLWDIDLSAGRSRRLPLSGRGLMNPDLAPDGRRLLYQAGESRSEIWAVENTRFTPR